MRKILVIGDVHGKIKEYENILNKYNPDFSIQVGDFGFREEHDWFYRNINIYNHRINFGNHDDCSLLLREYSLGNYSYFQSWDTITVRGADSIDKQYRIEGVSWWRNEELSYQEMNEAMEFYIKTKPSIMITHDCPQSIREKVFGIYDKSVTSQGLQSMLEFHRPKLWIFGHHHKSITININDTVFKCLNELEIFELKI